MGYSMSADCEVNYTRRERIYGLKIKNNSKETKECVLFGVNKNSTLVNYGSDPEVRVNSTINGVNYHQIVSHPSLKKGA